MQFWNTPGLSKLVCNPKLVCHSVNVEQSNQASMSVSALITGSLNHTVLKVTLCRCHADSLIDEMFICLCLADCCDGSLPGGEAWVDRSASTKTILGEQSVFVLSDCQTTLEPSCTTFCWKTKSREMFFWNDGEFHTSHAAEPGSTGSPPSRQNFHFQLLKLAFSTNFHCCSFFAR